MIKRIACASALIMCSFVPASAQQFDDPAVAACEFMLHEGKPAPANYNRTGAHIEGLDVTIEYTTTVLNVAPRARSYKCTFRVNENGTFGPGLPEMSDEVAKCQAFVADEMPNFQSMARAKQLEAKAEMERCEPLLTGFVVRGLKLLTEVYQPLAEMDLMEIPPSETALRAH